MIKVKILSTYRKTKIKFTNYRTPGSFGISKEARNLRKLTRISWNLLARFRAWINFSSSMFSKNLQVSYQQILICTFSKTEKFLCGKKVQMAVSGLPSLKNTITLTWCGKTSYSLSLVSNLEASTLSEFRSLQEAKTDWSKFGWKMLTILKSKLRFPIWWDITLSWILSSQRYFSRSIKIRSKITRPWKMLLDTSLRRRKVQTMSQPQFREIRSKKTSPSLTKSTATRKKGDTTTTLALNQNQQGENCTIDFEFFLQKRKKKVVLKIKSIILEKRLLKN